MQPKPTTVDADWQPSIAIACEWLAGVAQVKTERLTIEEDPLKYGYASWQGAIRGEYRVAERRWSFFGPVWHTGQAVKALVMASRYLGREDYLQAARAGAAFIFDKQVWQKGHPDYGLILAYEDFPDKVNTSAVLECMSGLILLADEEHSDEFWNRIIAAGDFLIDRAYLPEAGVFRDVYDPSTHSVVLPNPCRAKDNKGGRPLIEDAVFVRLYAKTGAKKFLDCHIRLSETLVADQHPAGNWIDYGPCNAAKGSFHPRHTYWWGLPLLETYYITGREEFLRTAIASGNFCRRAMRSDGGWIRGLYWDEKTACLKTDCFGHATSGSACAALLFVELYRVTGDVAWLKDAEKALGFCRRMQFTNPDDPNLKGAILEKVLGPDGTDRSPYYIRDLGTIFYVMAAVKYLEVKRPMPSSELWHLNTGHLPRPTFVQTSCKKPSRKAP